MVPSSCSMTYAGSSSLPLRVMSLPLDFRVTFSWWTSVTLPEAVELPQLQVTSLPLRMLMRPSQAEGRSGTLVAMTLFDLTDRLALVTGSSRGLGRTFATGLAGAGARVVLHGRDEEALQEARAEIGATTGREPLSVSFDVTEPEEVRASLAGLVAAHGVPDILVNNAGTQRRAPFAEFSTRDWDEVLATNLSSAFHVSQALVGGMIARGSGKIVNVASVQSRLARETIAPYAAAKGGLVLLTQGMAADLARHGIQVNALSPGYFATEMNRALVEDPEFSGWVRGRTPAGRWGRVEELVGTLVYLASDASSFVSGQNIVVDGGMTAVV